MTRPEAEPIPTMPRDSSPSRPHVVMISGHAPPVLDGVGDYAAPLLAELARQRPEWRWTLLTRRPGFARSPIASGPGYRVVRPNHTWTERGRRVACATLRRLRPSLVHIQEQIHSFFETDAAARLASATDAPVVTTLHEYHIELPSVVHTDATVRRSAAIIANDTRNAERCLDRTGREVDGRWWSSCTVPPPGPGEAIRREPDLAATFGFLSGLKAIDRPMGALRLLRDRGRALRWRIVGPFDPEANPDHARIAAMADPRLVEFTGAVPGRGPRLRRLLAAARLMLLPYADGASLRRGTLHVAWAFGLPAITTPPPCDEPAIVDGENCLLVREPTAEAWADALERVLDDPALEARLSAGGLRAAEQFGWPELARRHLALYDRLLATGAGA